ncbi:aminoacyl-histidine dipeptidase [Peptoniphilus equinus]|uniref:Aminoacyl-histidine dipeptidase n=1 Tax=Peptoniphilus equinus TaxID=3016343 RepID=A0ABY7QV82_9FIRM|nr:aminoacyl-histidine dipeptidase [Peptoniphilus equinus]WBW50306.1 aminoacyl-histidine dipeptidase [Peptoniphilus equinus]
MNLEPKDVFHWFHELNQVPRCSGQEEAVSKFLENFAKERGFEVRRDDANNVIIKVPATAGYENRKSVIIQGHMDMVCVKDPGVNHNFDTDPIDMEVDGDFLKAKGTTLGGDDGIAVAFAMAILDGDYPHPELTVLITTEEETTMNGANAIKSGDVTGDYLFNIDSEEEGIFLVSSAGGAETYNVFKGTREAAVEQGIKITVKDLEGGHSGMEINKGRGNANVFMGRLLAALKDFNPRLSTINGGTKHNAIASHGEAVLTVSDADKAKAVVEALGAQLLHEVHATDPRGAVEVSDADVDTVFDATTSANFIHFLRLVPNGVYSMSQDIDGLVESSLNNAVITTEEDTITFVISVRSSSESRLDEVLGTIETLDEVFGGKFDIENAYPGWEYEPGSKIEEIVKATWSELYGDAKFEAVHAGLECGVLKKVLPDTEMISFGPNMFDVHSPKEKLSISSTERVFQFTLALLQAID